MRSILSENSGILTPSTSEYDLSWREGFYRGNQIEMIRVGFTPTQLESLQKAELWRQTRTGGLPCEHEGKDA